MMALASIAFLIPPKLRIAACRLSISSCENMSLITGICDCKGTTSEDVEWALSLYPSHWKFLIRFADVIVFMFEELYLRIEHSDVKQLQTFS